MKMSEACSNNSVKKFLRHFRGDNAFPLDLEGIIPWVLPLAIIKLPRLGLDNILSWLEFRDISFKLSSDNRGLCGCLLAQGGKGLVFIDGCDPEDERRYSLAHEVAHFLNDYLIPRKNLVECFGQEILQVLDGHRSPTSEERLQGVFNGVVLGQFVHYMDRNQYGEIAQSAVLEAEDAADRLALEILAPSNIVRRHLEKMEIDYGREDSFDKICRFLIKEFGLPANIAKSYGNSIVMRRRSTRTVREWLGM
jgi:hypothetical protein